jgi:hypothetical protein
MAACLRRKHSAQSRSPGNRERDFVHLVNRQRNHQRNNRRGPTPARRGLASLPLLLLALGLCADAAQSQPTANLPATLLWEMLRASDIDDYRRAVVALVASYERVEGTVLVSDLVIAEARDAAFGRAASLGRIMSYDFDEDGRVSRAEIAEGFPDRAEPKHGYPNEWQRWVNDQTLTLNRRNALAQVDADGSGAIDFAEAFSASKLRHGPSYSRLRAVRALFDRDPDQDGRLTNREAEAIAADLFNGFDVDRNGKIDGAEQSVLSAACNSANLQER